MIVTYYDPCRLKGSHNTTASDYMVQNYDALVTEAVSYGWAKSYEQAHEVFMQAYMRLITKEEKGESFDEALGVPLSGYVRRLMKDLSRSELCGAEKIGTRERKKKYILPESSLAGADEMSEGIISRTKIQDMSEIFSDIEEKASLREAIDYCIYASEQPTAVINLFKSIERVKELVADSMVSFDFLRDSCKDEHYKESLEIAIRQSASDDFHRVLHECVVDFMG